MIDGGAVTDSHGKIQNFSLLPHDQIDRASASYYSSPFNIKIPPSLIMNRSVKVFFMLSLPSGIRDNFGTIGRCLAGNNIVPSCASHKQPDILVSMWKLVSIKSE
jgi:hypothetical protein